MRPLCLCLAAVLAIPTLGLAAGRGPARPDSGPSRPRARPAVPQTGATGRNPFDGFVGAEWATGGLTPVAPADKRILLRRFYLDLIGLPPTAEQYEAFVADPS